MAQHRRVQKIRGEEKGTIFIATPQKLWQKRLTAARTSTKKNKVWPMSVGHLMFKNPGQYGAKALKPLTYNPPKPKKKR